MATHIKILNKSEIEEFESAPDFNASERKKYLYISDWIKSNISNYDSDVNKVCFVLMFGYFRASKRLIQIKYFDDRDINYVAHKLNISVDKQCLASIPKATLSRYKKLILEYFSYSSFGIKEKEMLRCEANNIVAKQIKPKSLFDLLVKFLISKRIEVPKYYGIAEIITNSFNSFEQELVNKINVNLSSDQKLLLDSLLNFKESENGSKNYRGLKSNGTKTYAKEFFMALNPYVSWS